jgi:carbonic anhydrase
MAALLDAPDPTRMPGLARWVDVARSLRVTSTADQDPTTRLRTLVESNVVLQLNHLRSYPYICHAEEAGRLTLHGWLYDLALPGVLHYDAQSDSFQSP